MDSLNEFKKKQFKVCTSFPLYEFLQEDLKLYKELSQRSEKEFGENLLGKYCAKREMCFDNCLGRPIPKFKELEPFLYKIKANLIEGEYKGKEVYLYKVTLCNSCPFSKECNSLCSSMESYLNKQESTNEPFENRTVSYDDFINYDNVIENKSLPKKKKEDIPWNVLSLEQIEVVKLRALSLLTWKEISDYMEQEVSYCRRLFQRAIKKLKRVAKAIEKSKLQLDDCVKLFIQEGLTVEEISNKTGLPKRTVYNKLSKILNPSNNQ